MSLGSSCNYPRSPRCLNDYTALGKFLASCHLETIHVQEFKIKETLKKKIKKKIFKKYNQIANMRICDELLK